MMAEKTKFKPGERIIHKRRKWKCIAIHKDIVAVFARIDVKKAVVRSSTYLNLKKLIAVANDPDINDGFKYIRMEEGQ